MPLKDIPRMEPMHSREDDLQKGINGRIFENHIIPISQMAQHRAAAPIKHNFLNRGGKLLKGDFENKSRMR